MDESYWDVSELEQYGFAFDTDVSANLHALQQTSAYGRAYSPSFGGGTCDVEFEALTGYSVSYLPNGSKPLAGSPQLNPDAFAARMHKEGDKYYRIPKELNAGYAKEVIITTSDGKTAQVMTDKPIIDTDNLKTR